MSNTTPIPFDFKTWEKDCWNKLRATGFAPNLRLTIQPPDSDALLQDEDIQAQAASTFPHIDELLVVPERATVETGNGNWIAGHNLQVAVRVVFFTHQDAPGALGFLANGQPKILPVSTTESGTLNWFEDIHKRNQAAGLEMPLALANAFATASAKPQKAASNVPQALAASEFYTHTGEEWTTCMNMIDDGRRGLHLMSDPQRGSIQHRRPGARFSAEMLLLEEERDAGYGVELLQGALEKLDADDKLTWLYVSQLLAPVEPLLQNTFAGGWVDLDDVARRTLGGAAPNPTVKAERRAKVYHAIRMGARTEIIGQRTIPYTDKQTGQIIDTRLHTSPWKIMGRELPEQPTLFAVDTIPLRVELVTSREWSALTTHRDTAQYLPFGEVLGAIPGSQAGGAWARALGLAYLDWCRMNLLEALAGEPVKWTRKGFLERHRAKVAPYDEVLEGRTPSDVLKHWRKAEDLLREAGLIEAPRSPTAPSKRQGWAAQWLRDPLPWKPGTRLRPVLEAMAQNKYVEKPRQLNAAKRKGGRPRKQPQT